MVRERASVRLSLPLPHFIIAKEKWKSISYAVMNGATFLISLPHSRCCPPPPFSLPFLFFTTKSKRPEDWEESIFVRHKECSYRLRDNIHFHMYISTSPCGDGRLNSPYEITTDRKTSSPSVSFVLQIYNEYKKAISIHTYTSI